MLARLRSLHLIQETIAIEGLPVGCGMIRAVFSEDCSGRRDLGGLMKIEIDGGLGLVV